MKRAVSGVQSACKSCRKAGRPDRSAEGRAYYEANRTAVLEAQATRRRTDPEFRARAAERHTRWVEQNAERHRAYMNVYLRARRALLAKPDKMLREYAAILRGDPCAYCGERGGVIDHIWAVARGGANTWENVTAACGRCNRSKGTKPLLMFLLTRVGEV